MRVELARFTLLDIVEFPVANLMAMCVGKNVINNPDAIREDDVVTGDIVFFYEDCLGAGVKTYG